MKNPPYKMIAITNREITEKLEQAYNLPIVYGENEDPSLNDYEYFYYYEGGITNPDETKTNYYQDIYIIHVSKLVDTELEIDIANTLKSLGLKFKSCNYERVEIGETKRRLNMSIHHVTRPVRGACI